MCKRLPDIADYLAVESLNGGDYCAKKNLVCYSSNRTGGVVVKGVGGGMEFVIPAKGVGFSCFSPDGRYILYLAAAEQGGRQIFCWDTSLRRSRQVTNFPGPILEPIWSPDSSRILFSSPFSQEETPQEQRDDDVVVIEDFGYKFDGRGFIRPNAHMNLYVVELETGSVTALTRGSTDYFQHNWSPDGRHVVCISARNRQKSESLGFDLFLLDADAPEELPRQISDKLNMVSYPNPTRPVFSPDGRFVYMGVMDPEMDYRKGYPEILIFRFPVDGSGGTQVFQKDAGCYQCVQFPYNAGCGSGFDKVQMAEDGSSLFFVSGWQGQCNLYCLPLEGDGHARLIAGGKQVYNGLGRPQGGKMLVARSQSHCPESYWLMDVHTGELLEKVVQSARELLGDVSFSQAQDIIFPTLDGESNIHGWVLPPQNREPGKKYPAILYIHGGPHPFYTYGFTMEHQCLAAQGFGVIFCNPRGSSGYGITHQNVARATDGSAYMDCLQFVDEVIRRFDWIDGDRLGVTGGSYGGYMTNYIAGHSRRFKAFVTQRSVVNDLIGYASSDMQGCSTKFKSFEEFMVAQLRSSTISYAEQMDRPFLILHGMEDYRTPVEGAHQLYVALKDLHPEVPVKMLLFPHVGHDQPADPRQKRIYFLEMVNWFKKYL